MPSIYIVSAGRPHCETARTLSKIGCDGFSIAVSDGDALLEDYISEWGDKVRTYSYDESMARTDMMDGFDDPIGGAAPARNGVLDLAAASGEKRFWMLDDDLTAFTLPKKPPSRSRKTVKDWGELAEAMNRIDDWATAASLPVVGGVVDMQGFPPEPWKTNPYVRQAYSIDPSYGVRFRSRMEEDLAFSCDLLRTGGRPIGLCLLGVRTKGVCEDAGGCTTIYEKNGTVRRAAYNVLACPTTRVKCDKFGYSGFPRWKLLTPKIVSSRWKRG